MKCRFAFLVLVALVLAASAGAQGGASTTSFTYDANGNVTSKAGNGAVRTYIYDARNLLVEVQLNGLLLERYQYDPEGRRVKKTGPDGVVRYVWDGDKVLLETDDGGNTTAKYDYAGDRLVAVHHVTEGTAFYLLDALESPVALSRADGSIPVRYRWDAWGQSRGSTGDSSNPFGFTGFQRDEATGLCYAKARFYDPEVGRFLTEDPFAGDPLTPASLHRYVYAFGNPTIYVDRNGRCVGDWADSAACVAIKNAAEATWNWVKQPFVSAAQNAGVAAEETAAGFSAIEEGFEARRYSAAEVEAYLEEYGSANASAPALRKLGQAGGSFQAASEYAGQAAIDAYSAAERAELLAGTGYLAWEAGKFVVKRGLQSAAGSAVDDLARGALPGAGHRGLESGIVIENPNAAGMLVADDLPQGTFAGSGSASRPAWLDKAERGSAFNKAHQFDYPARELYLDAPGGGYIRLDAHDPIVGEIVSRKLTQLGDVRESTAIGYLNELATKYPAGARIANVPSSGPLAGQFIQGQQILEVPIQKQPIPAAILEKARRLNIVVRDVAGKVY